MTKEELEKEAEEWVISNTEIYDDKFGIECENAPQAKEAYLASAEPREKRIAELETRCNELFLQTCEQAELIEKMKCCKNCSKDCGSIDRRICFENKMKDWELKE